MLRHFSGRVEGVDPVPARTWLLKLSELMPGGFGLTLRQQLGAVTGVLVAATILLTASVSYLAAITSLVGMMDNDMRSQGAVLAYDSRYLSEPDLLVEIETLKRRSPYLSVSVSPPGQSKYLGDAVPVGGKFVETRYNTDVSTRTLAGHRVVVTRTKDGATVALSKEIDPTQQLLRSVAAASLVLVSLGGLVSWTVASLVSESGLRPLRRLQRGVKEVTRTEELNPLPVEGHDELARITIAFNDMMETLRESRKRQTQLVADAGHELKTPLTSMRTNIELLMMVYASEQQDMIPAEDRADLERDVLAQMNELSTLIGDLVDLAREDAPNIELEEMRLDLVLGDALGRVQRRRPDVHFLFHADPWILRGDKFAMGRAPLNLIDNAAKWSPKGGTVRVSLKAGSSSAVLLVDDSGPGIAPEERERVFERFYRSAESRSMPGSGLGLAIVKQVMDRHDAPIYVEDSPAGGARFRVIFPGRRPDPGEDTSHMGPFEQ